VIRGKHDPASRRNYIEAGVVYAVETLAISDPVINLESLLLCPFARRLDQGRRKVNTYYVGPRARRALRDSARATSQIQPVFASFRLEASHNQLVDISDRFRNPMVRAIAPHRALPLLQLFEWHLFLSNACARLTEPHAAR